jgi:hypothetical protein
LTNINKKISIQRGIAVLTILLVYLKRIVLISLSSDTQNGNSNPSTKHLWIKKATGLGVSEFMLRFMAWLCLKDNSLAGSQMCIVTGPRIDLAIALIDRMKKLFAGSRGLTTASFDTKEIFLH